MADKKKKRRRLTFWEVIKANRARTQQWHKLEGYFDISWTGADWGNAMAGEAGEACNVVKKLRRVETGAEKPNKRKQERQRHMLGLELADTILYATLLADHYGIDLEQAIVEKFNLVSDQKGFPQKLKELT